MSQAESLSRTLIQTKLHRPRLRSDLVERPRLMTQLACGLEHKVTLISAPAGYGKTTLLCQWLETCPHPSAWLSLDENDSDLGVFVRYLVGAVRTAYPGTCGRVDGLLQAPSAAPWEYKATVLLNDLVELPGSLTLAMDDYHSIHAPQVHQLLAQVIRYLPGHVHLAIASRTDPPLAIDRLRAGRELVEVRARDLRFSEGETEAYLETALGPALARESAAILASRTEGWIVGLHLASLWLRGTADPTGILADSGDGRSRFAVDYLAAEVLARQPDRIQRFLVQTSVLDRLCAGLCDAVAGLPSGSSSAVLDELVRDNVFLVPLGEPGGWYRCHHLFDEMLEMALHSQIGKDQVPALHRRASGWFAANGHIEHALHHALQAGDVESAVSLVEDNAYGLLNRLERHTLERWLALLPRDAVWRSPRLLVAQAWLLYRQSRRTALDAVLVPHRPPLRQVRPGRPLRIAGPNGARSTRFVLPPHTWSTRILNAAVHRPSSRSSTYPVRRGELEPPRWVSGRSPNRHWAGSWRLSTGWKRRSPTPRTMVWRPPSCISACVFATIWPASCSRC